MERYFNIAGPCVPDKHCMIPALERLPEMARLISREQSFVIHAARQSGKTTALLTLVAEINRKAEMRAVYFTLESVQRFSNPQEGIPRIVAAMRNALLSHRVFGEWARAMRTVELTPGVMVPDVGVKTFLAGLAESSDRPLAVFFDEVDCLSDDTLITFLRELRDGVVNSRSVDPDSHFQFPVSLALVGMRDIRDYKAQVRSDSQALGSGRLDLCVEFRGHRYALELKMRRNFSHDKSLAQFVGYLDRLGLNEGWMPVFDGDKAKSWDERLCLRDEAVGGKIIHIVGL